MYEIIDAQTPRTYTHTQTLLKKERYVRVNLLTDSVGISLHSQPQNGNGATAVLDCKKQRSCNCIWLNHIF